jgi:diguanylate cyclase (GGDEF)-like protein
MATFFSAQLDFIFFFYGLAFLLLGATSFGIARSGAVGVSWVALGAFAYLHGVGEWLDLSALIVGDPPAFAVLRTTLMTVSYFLLMEFARLEATRLGQRPPGRWAYVLLGLVIAAAWVAAGEAVAAACARYLVGFVGGLAAAAVFAAHARALAGAPRRAATGAAIGFGLYAVAAGLVPAPAPIWPASVVNADWFVQATGTPIQLARGLLACWLAFCIWAVRQHQLAVETSSEPFAEYLRRQFVWSVSAMATILLCGWVLTNFLGEIYKQTVRLEARGDMDLLSSRLAGETRALEAMTRTLAGSPSVRGELNGAGPEAEAAARSVLDLHVEASGADVGLLLNASGVVVAASGRDSARALQRDYRSKRYFADAMAGGIGHCLTFERDAQRVEFYGSTAIVDGRGATVGVAALGASLDRLGAELQRSEIRYFLVAPDGVVAMTNRPGRLLRAMWPLSADRRSDALRRFGEFDDRPMLKREVVDGGWAMVDGERDYLLRSPVGGHGWSLVIASPMREIFASRVLGIVVTLLVAIITLVYLVGKERRLHDAIQMERRLHLQELARDLGQQAVTDPLTGLFNRLKFDQALASEMLRSSRYRSPLSLVLFDVDHFKTINDVHGHTAGDKTLVRLAQAMSRLVRETDLLARWGGEEFVLLVPGGDAGAARQVAEKLRAAIEKMSFDEIGRVTCSFGVTQFVDGDAAEDIVGRADEALYRAKLEGRNRVVTLAKPRPGKTGLLA